ncbi:MAG: hypothetical protein O2U61_00830, partial [Candidatus Bathyarchaeota archaeon]|nr:hypothetical protein [Candidatus Bathyarchaeota archaeon]
YQTPLFLKRGISFLGLAPRKFVQEKLNFWKSEDTKSLKMFKERLNLKFKKDWDSIEFKKL